MIKNPSELTKDQQQFLIRLWGIAGREVDRIRTEALHDKPYNPEEVDALLQLGDTYDGPPRLTSGLVEMQKLFWNTQTTLQTKNHFYNILNRMPLNFELPKQ